jgi:deaminated glutathione amidase
MRVSVVQLNSQSDVGENLQAVEKLLAKARGQGAELVVLPENFAFMGETETDKCAIAEDPAKGPIGTAICGLASKFGLSIVAGGMPERSTDPKRPYNTSLFISSNGRILAKYRKIHLFDVALADGTTLSESAATLAGDEPCVVPWLAPIGMTVCYDLRFPELFRSLVDRGAQVITVPSAFTVTTGKDHWHVLLRARAIESQAFVLAAGQHGKHPKGRQTYGKSVIVDPWGDVLAQCGEGPGVATADLDFGYLTEVRKGLPCLTHRRPELFAHTEHVETDIEATVAY